MYSVLAYLWSKLKTQSSRFIFTFRLFCVCFVCNHGAPSSAEIPCNCDKPLPDFSQKNVISFVTEFEATWTTMTDFIPIGMFGFHRQVITGVVDAGMRSSRSNNGQQ